MEELRIRILDYKRRMEEQSKKHGRHWQSEAVTSVIIQDIPFIQDEVAAKVESGEIPSNKGSHFATTRGFVENLKSGI